MKPRERITKALGAAVEFSAGVRPPFNFCGGVDMGKDHGLMKTHHHCEYPREGRYYLLGGKVVYNKEPYPFNRHANIWVCDECKKKIKKERAFAKTKIGKEIIENGRSMRAAMMHGS